MIEIISHRGYWKSSAEKNMFVAFERSFSLGFGTETDVRDSLRDGACQLVISHDVPGGAEMLLSEVLAIAAAHGSPTLAINIKADGLADRLKAALVQFDYSNYFTFDHSVPDLIQTEQRGLRCFTRLSEFEPEASLYDAPHVVGVWIDAFKPGRWYDQGVVERILDDGKQACLVAPDLHRRHAELIPFFDWLGNSGLASRDGLILCTDQPELAVSHLLSR